jgi:hypothetical protein
MALGPGKYDAEATLVRSRTGGGVVVIVFGGHKGHGFSVQASVELTMELPRILENIAREMRKDLKGGGDGSKA